MLAPSPYPPFAAVDVTFVITGTAVSMVNVEGVELAFPAVSVARTVTLAVPSMYVLPVAAVTV